MTAARPLRTRIIEATFYSFGMFGVLAGVRMTSHILVARVLEPADYAVLSIVMSIRMGLAVFLELGLAPAIIRSNHADDQKFINTAWVIQMIQGALLMLFILIAAGMLGLITPNPETATDTATVLHDPRLKWLLLVAGLAALIESTQSVRTHLATRALEARKPAQIQLIVVLCGSVATVSYAYAYRSIWAFAAGMLISAIMLVILSHIVFRDSALRPRLCRRYFREIFHFGKWLTLSSALFFLVQRGDRIAASIFFTPHQLGLYEVARTWLDPAVTALAKFRRSVFTPALSARFREKQPITQIYYRFRLFMDGLYLLAALVMIFIMPSVFNILYTDSYTGAEVYFLPLALFLILKSYDTLGFVMTVVGRTNIAALNQLLNLFGLTAFIAVGIWAAGPHIIPYAPAVTVCLLLPYRLMLKRRHLKLNMVREVLPLAAATALLFTAFQL